VARLLAQPVSLTNQKECPVLRGVVARVRMVYKSTCRGLTYCLLRLLSFFLSSSLFTCGAMERIAPSLLPALAVEGLLSLDWGADSHLCPG